MKIYNYITFVTICLILILTINCYIESNVIVQDYLPSIYENQLILENKYKNFLSSNYNFVLNDSIIYIENILDRNFYDFLIKQINKREYDSNNLYFRKGNGVSFYNLHRYYNGFIEFYHSNELKVFLQKIFKKIINRPSMNDKSCCSLLIYSKKGDYIDWHYDYSSYYGDRYTILLTLINENSKKTGLSSNTFVYIDNNGVKKEIKCKPNSAIIFQGSKVFHKSTPIDNGEKRILLSMTFCDICQQKTNIFNSTYDRVKDFVVY